jgi:hypothetical protein
LRELVTAYERRYHRQLRDIGIATALAQHDPQGLDKLLPPAGPSVNDEQGKPGSKWW